MKGVVLIVFLAIAIASCYGLDKNCTCAEFCNHTCAATNAGTVHIQEMYRLSPGNVTALADKDTGDAYKPIVRKFTVVLDGKW
eukprot:gene19711-28864_t